jgi:transcriptional regulator with XRE-family HTH domain
VKQAVFIEQDCRTAHKRYSEVENMNLTGEQIGESLKRYRKSRGLSVPQVAALMEKNYHIKVATKTIYGWESNQCCPPTPKMLALCEIYQINDISTSFATEHEEGKNFAITPLERRVVLGFRDNPGMQAAVCRLVGVDDYETKNNLK